MAKKNLYVLVPTNKGEGVPMLKVRNAERRNTRRLSKRVARFTRMHGESVARMLDNGTMIVVPVNEVTTLTVKRDAEREARKTGRTLVTTTA